MLYSQKSQELNPTDKCGREILQKGHLLERSLIHSCHDKILQEEITGKKNESGQ